MNDLSNLVYCYDFLFTNDNTYSPNFYKQPSRNTCECEFQVFTMIFSTVVIL